MDRRNLMLLIVVLCIVGAVPHFANAQKKPKGKVIVPAWKIQLVDEAGNPVKDVFVRQVWLDYDIEDDGHEEDARSDEHGFVSFPERREKRVSSVTQSQEKIKEPARAWCSR